jgi:hypothetical protein
MEIEKSKQSKMDGLQQALNRTGKITSQLQAQPVPATPPNGVDRIPSRIGLVNVACWLHPNYKSSLHLIHASKARLGIRATIQDLHKEALNNLFAKYDVPTVSE